MYKSFLIKYAEIGVKGKNRYLFEEALVKQIKYALKKAEGEFLVRRTDGRIYVDAQSDFDFDEVVESLKKVFGISGICPVVHVEDAGFEKLCQDVTRYIGDVYPDRNKSFKVAARRARKNYPLNSMQLNEELGGVILDAYPVCGRAQPGYPFACGNSGQDIPLLRDHTRSRRYACGDGR